MKLPALTGLLMLSLFASGVGAEEQRVPSFTNEIIPLLTRYGCNQGACHGKQAGQNGFRLSLRGYAPEQDHFWIAREYLGRRVNGVNPAGSLMLRKPLGIIPHGGAKLFEPDSPAAKLLTDWIAAGCPGPEVDQRTVTELRVLPGDQELRPGQELLLLVQAISSDGEVRDVTWLSQFFSSDAGIVEVSPTGLVSAKRSGQATVRVHFLQHVQTITLTLPAANVVPPQRYELRNNTVDEHVFQKLKTLRIPPADLCDDATFLRRAHVDLIGTLPTPAEVRAFLEDAHPEKRSRLVEQLLDRPEFVDYWTLRLADLLQNRRERDHDVRGPKGVRNFHAWLRGQVAANRSWKELTREVLLAKGDAFAQPQVGYYIVTVGEKREAEQSEVVAAVAQSFLGTRIGCAQCHNHPLEKYTQDDYYHFAGFFSRISFDRQSPQQGATQLYVATPHRGQLLQRIAQYERKIQELESTPGDQQAELTKQREELGRVRQELENYKSPPVEARQPRTGKMLPPQPLDRAAVAVGPDDDPRQALFDWMTRPDNEYFSGNMVNRLWKHFLGTGLVEPVDDLRPSNPPTNQPLWKYLNQEFVASDYNLKHLMRLIVNSRTYQLASGSVAENQDDTQFYSHFYPRRLPAEVSLDALSQALDVPEEFPGYPVGIRAIQIPEPEVQSYYLSVFGRPERITSCACERTEEMTLLQSLHLYNGDWYSKKLQAPAARPRQLAESSLTDEQWVTEAYLWTVGRLPRADEWPTIRQHLASTPRPEAVQDIFWALLNTKEFMFQH